MNQPEIECRECGVQNSSRAVECSACGKPLATVEATMQSDPGSAATTPSLSDTEAVASTELSGDSDPVVADAPAEATMLGRPDHPLIGSMVGEYRVSALIGEGGMGTVFAGVQPLIGKEVAIKVLKPSLSDDSEVMERFLAEAKAVNTIRHPNIIDIFSFGQLEDESQYFVMEHLSGRNLAQLIKAKKTVAYDDALNIIKQVLGALKAAHERGIVHRDLKPDNIYLADHPGGGFIVKLLDFGIAKFTEDGISVGHTRTGVPIGTPLYMSPEQCRGRDVGHHADLYSLGVIMYEMFTGRPPFEAKTVYQLVNSHVHEPPVKPSTLIDFPDELERIILWCLAKDQADRPESAAKLEEVLIPVLEHLAGADKPAPTPMPALPRRAGEDSFSASVITGPGASTAGQAGPSRLTIAVVGLVLAVAVGVVLYFVLRRDPTPPPKQAATPTQPAVMAGVDAAAPRRAAPKMVWLRFRLSPLQVKKRITVDGKPVTAGQIQLPYSESGTVRVVVKADGYQPYVEDWRPLFDETLRAKLEKIGAMTSMRVVHRRRRRRRGMTTAGMRVAPRPVVMRRNRLPTANMLED